MNVLKNFRNLPSFFIVISFFTGFLIADTLDVQAVEKINNRRNLSIPHHGGRSPRKKRCVSVSKSSVGKQRALNIMESRNTPKPNLNGSEKHRAYQKGSAENL